MSLESGVMLFRLNHELLPEPGRPIERMTAPFGGLGGAAGMEAGAAGGVAASEDGVGGAAVCVAGLVPGRWPLRPRPPRVLLRRGRCWPPRVPSLGAGSPTAACSGSGASTRPGSMSGSGSAVVTGSEGAFSASKYAGCKGACAGSPGFDSLVFLRRFKRSLIHLRM